MIIKIIPETEEEKARSSEVEYSDVKEFFLMGNNVLHEENGSRLNEFHEWTGSYRYLIGTMSYYIEVINDERRGAQSRPRPPSQVAPQLRMIEPEVDQPEDGNEEGDTPEE